MILAIMLANSVVHASSKLGQSHGLQVARWAILVNEGSALVTARHSHLQQLVLVIVQA